MKTAIAALFACSALCQTIAAAEMQVQRELRYAAGQDKKQTLDVYRPAEGEGPAGKDTGRPIVFWVHGGGWMRGDKAEVKLKPQLFVDAGCVFVSTNYRVFPDVSIRTIAEDVAQALRWTHDHARDFGGDPNRILVMGHSAGAQLAALVATDERLLKAEGLPLSILKGCVPVDGDTYDVPLQIATVEPARADRYRWKFGSSASQADLSPALHVAQGKGIPPFLILHVAGHPETGLQSQRLARALNDAGIAARAFGAEGKDHDSLNDELGTPDDRATVALPRVRPRRDGGEVAAPALEFLPPASARRCPWQVLDEIPQARGISATIFLWPSEAPLV